MTQMAEFPKPPPDSRFQYNTRFQQILCTQYGFKWRRAVIVDWVSRGASPKDVSRWLNMSHYVVNDHLSRAYRSFGIGGRGALLLLVGVRQRLDK